METQTPTPTPTENMHDNNKKYWVIGLGILAVLLIVYLFWKNGQTPIGTPNQNEQGLNPTSSLTSAVVPTSTPTSTPNAAKKSTTKVSTPISATQRYLDALKIYKNSGYYFQFVDCHASPGSLTMKKGKKFMLDNRDGFSRKIAIYQYQTFTVGAYGYAIATAPNKAGTYYITCNGGGSASILVQN
ncbi:MAG: hypothetical protein WC526_03320 [Patescibacteria group bacterium]